MNDKLKQVREALEFYNTNVSDCNKTTNEGDIVRDRLAKDHGRKAAAALKSLQGKVIVDEGDLISLYNNGYLAGHHDTVEGGFVDIFSCDMTTYHEDVVKEIISDLTKEDSDETT